METLPQVGDSGAWVVGEENNLCGFIIGRLNGPSNLGHRAYITDIIMLWDEIVQMVGENLELPGPFFY